MVDSEFILIDEPHQDEMRSAQQLCPVSVPTLCNQIAKVCEYCPTKDE
jgi:hypothetical protein